MDENKRVYEIRGTVRGRSGDVLPGAHVVIWWQQIRTRQELAAGETSRLGTYHLKYEVPNLAPQSMLIVVEVDSKYLDAPLLSPLTAAQPSLDIDLNFEPSDQSEWATLERSIEPLLHGLKLSELVENSTHQDISIVACELGRGPEIVMCVAVSARLGIAFNMPAAVFYAFIRQRLPSALPDTLLDLSQNFTLITPLIQNISSLIFSLSAQAQMQALKGAIALNLIGRQFTVLIPQLVSELQELRTTDLLTQPYLVQNATLSQLLDVAALPQAKQRTFAQTLAVNNQSMRDFWATLGDGQHGLTAKESLAIERVLCIGTFVDNFLPLVLSLVERFKTGEWVTLADLARLTLADWITLVNQTGPPPGVDTSGTTSPSEAFASVIYARVAHAYPTAALASRISTGNLVPQYQQQPLIKFFQNNPELELLKHNISDYLSTQGTIVFEGISERDQTAVIANIRSFQRVLRIAPNSNVAETLLRLGINSAIQIVTQGRQQFLLKVTATGLTASEAEKTFRAAVQRYANVVALYMRFNREALGVWPKAMGQVSDLSQSMEKAIQRDPSLATLFGSQDYCATDDCASILSPAAYLCDLLLWLRNHKSSSLTALDVLDTRRPDIRHLLLNCSNTDTELPYIDLVNELLEDMVCPPVDLISTSYTKTALDNGTTYYYIVTAVNSVGEGAPSSQVSAIPVAPTAAPSAPTGVSATPGDALATISWNAVPGATSYNLYWSTSPGVTTVTGTKVMGVADPFTQMDLVNGTACYFVVTAVNSVGESAPSSQVSATPAPTTTPSTPTGISATPSDGQITIGWNTVPAATEYNVYWSTLAGVTTATGSKITALANSLTQSALVNGTTYYYIVTAVNYVGESAPSSQFSATPIAPVAVPSAPTGVSATPGDALVTIGWNVVPGATSYNLYWSTLPGLTTTTGTKITGVGDPFTHMALVNGTMLYYILTAVNSAGESAPSSQVSATPIEYATVPPAPTGVSATPGKCETTIAWNAVPGATSYNIYWSMAPGVTPATGMRITGAWNPRWKQTSASQTASDLSAAPEYFNQGAYSTLSTACFPFTLPYSAGIDALRTNLQQMNLPLWQLRQALLPVGAKTNSQLAAVASERFAMTPHGVKLITTANFAPAQDVWNTPNPQSDLASLPAFLQASSLTYESLLELLQVVWVQAGLNVMIKGVDDTCMTGNQSLAPSPLDAGFLDRVHRFLRLWLSTGYKMWELDLLVRAPAVANGTLDVGALGALLSFRQLQDATGLAVDQQLSFYQDIDTSSHRDPDGSTIASLYERIFLTPSVSLLAPDPDLAAVLISGGISHPELSYHSAGIQAALGVSALDAETLIGLTDGQLTLGNLSFIYRVNTLAVASKLSVSNLLKIASLISPTTDSSASLASLFASLPVTLGFLAQAKAIQLSGLTLDSLTYLLMPPTTTTLASPVTNLQTSITVASATGFPAPNFYVSIGSENLLVTALGGARNTIWTVVRGQQGTAATAALSGAAVGLTGGWATTTQMTQANISTTLEAVQQATLNLLSASTTLVSSISATQTSITVSSDVGFPAPNFSVAIGLEILLVVAVSGNGNTVWTVVRGQQGTTAAPAVTGAAVTPTAGDLDGSVIATVSSNAHAANAPLLANDVTAFVLQNLQLNGKSLLAELEDPPMVASVTPWATFTIGGVPSAGDTLQTVLSDGLGHTISASYTLGPTDVGNIIQTTSNFVIAINTSMAGAGPSSFLARCTASGAVITLTAFTPVAPGSNITSTNTALPGGSGHVSITPGTTAMSSLPAITQTEFPNQFLALQLLDKVGVLIRGLHLVAADLSWLLANGSVYGGLDLAQLPVTAAQPSLMLSSLLTTLLVIKLARLWTAAPSSSQVQTLYDLIDSVSAGSEADTQGALAMITGWPKVNIEVFAKSLGISFPKDYISPAVYDALRILQAMAVTANASGEQIADWGTVPPDEPAAQGKAASALATLKAQQSNNGAWLALAPTLMNPIRDRRSASLQAYLIAQRDNSGQLIYEDANDLFNYLLIDVQMASCQVTTRVVQAYIAVQIFVERCLLNLEMPAVVVDPTQDDSWKEWEWMSRYRIWQANREVFLYPENWLIESQRPNRTEIFQTFEQEVRQGQSTADYLETVVLNYLDRLDSLAHLRVTGTFEDPSSGAIYVVACSRADPPVFYLRSFVSGEWTGWTRIPLDIKAHHVVPTLFRGSISIFWLGVTVSNEPVQTMPAAQANPSASPSKDVDRYVVLAIYFSTFRNGTWAPVQTTRGKLFDRPFFPSANASIAGPPNSSCDARTAEELYTIRVTSQNPTTLSINVYRRGKNQTNPLTAIIESVDETRAEYIGRVVFDGRISDLELTSMPVPYLIPPNPLPSVGYPYTPMIDHAWATYGSDARFLRKNSIKVDYLVGESPLIVQAGALTACPGLISSGPHQTQQLNFLPLSGEQNNGPLLDGAPVPFWVVGQNWVPAPNYMPSTQGDLRFDHTACFFFQDNCRCYYVETTKSPNSGSSIYEVLYMFHAFYHPFTRLFWNQLEVGGLDHLYDPNLQQNPDQIDTSGADLFNFQNSYGPTSRVQWDLDDVATTLASPITAAQTWITVASSVGFPSPGFYIGIGSEILLVTALSGIGKTTWTVSRGQFGTTAASAPLGELVTPTKDSRDRQFLDFSYGAPFSVYNWELFFHIPLFVAQHLSQNQQFEDAQTWFQYIFDPSRQGSESVPQRYWIPKPLRTLTGTQILQSQINNLLLDANQGNYASIQQIEKWRKNPFNPFSIADLRLVVYMKSTVMSYLDNLIAWGDNLFSSESREALSEATLIYVVASEILGTRPVAVTPPKHTDESFDQLEPSLDAFANAMVEIENVIGGADGSGGGVAHSNRGGIPSPSTFYFKIPSNPKMLGYWATVNDRLYKLRHCQNIVGNPLQLALFDAPIDPGLLTQAQAGGVDTFSVTQGFSASLPSYRFTSVYPQALDFVNAVRAYGSSLQAALEKADAGALALLQQTTQQQLLDDGSQILDWQVQEAENNIDSLNQTLILAQQRYHFNSSQSWPNTGEAVDVAISTGIAAYYLAAAVSEGIASIAHLIPEFNLGAAGFGGSPTATAGFGGSNVGDSASKGAEVGKAVAAALEKSAGLAAKMGAFERRQDSWDEAAAEAQIQIAQANAQLAGAQYALRIAQQNQTLHMEQIENLQDQIDFLNNKFTSDSLYQWMVRQLSDTYFKSYRLAYHMCKQVERCYRYELGIQNSSFIQFGYWDSLYKGLLAGETLNNDLRRMQASYLQHNIRRYELSRYISIGTQDAAALQQLLATGTCDFTLPESLFDNDYPGHYNRRLTRVSLTVVYPNPGKFDNVKATLTLIANQVRISSDPSSGYGESPIGSDPRFLYNYAAVPQKIATGNAQDDPGLFITAISNNITDQRYLPFENAGAISSWHLEMLQLNNEVDLSTVGDVVLHVYYTALDGGAALQTAVQANNAANFPTSPIIKVFSAQNDFVAPPTSGADPKPVAPWQGFLFPATAGADQMLTLPISASKFPAWTRGKIITVTSVTVIAIAWPSGTFVLVPQAPLPTAPITMTPVPGTTVPTVVAASIATPGTIPATWSFKIQKQGASDFISLTPDTIGDVLLLLSYTAS
jgi:Tc toxin complex TcA C-terminal TcB-binding domain/Neuraminidase-like domain/Salmonella virulence plasmid 28.1kDa A protein